METTPSQTSPATPSEHTASGSRLPALALGALGVVYGDIGTSPLYTMREALVAAGTVTHDTVLGVLSLVFWALIAVVTVKYVVIIMRADNRGEGGVLALGTLATRGLSGRRQGLLIGLAILGMALFYGDSLITPAISVLSAIEGLQLATPLFERYVVPLTLIVIVGLFAVQRHGTGLVGRAFGPVMLLWFGVLGVLGFIELLEAPEVLTAINPLYALRLVADHGASAFFILGSVVLAVTGAEALYADMGHFGSKPIRIVWLCLVFPALILNYCGQGALLLRDPAAIANPFYHLAPQWALLPLIVLATAATVIASQAVISGAFSLTRQAVQLGYLPRREIRHTSEHEAGQVYIPRNNMMLLFGVSALVIGFGSSSALASAYGVSVTGAMLIDAILAGVVAVRVWKWSPWLVGGVFAIFLVIDTALFGATLLKVPAGGWFPLVVAALVYATMATWRYGRRRLSDLLYGDAALPLDLFIDRISPQSPTRVSGTGVFLSGRPDVVPHQLLHNIKHNKVLHERVIFINVETVDVPRINGGLDGIAVAKLGKGFWRVDLRFGYMEQPNIPLGLERCRRFGLATDMMETSYFLGHATIIPSKGFGPKQWRERLYIAMQKDALSATAFFGLPPGRVVELGTQVEL
jgi:KUP system potassium uptake protein